MNKSDFWINIRLNEELHVSGAFIYNGLRIIHEISTYANEDEIFEALYNISVGLERVMKVAVALIEHESAADQEKFEKSLITHNLTDLTHRINKRHELSLPKYQKELLHLLTVFYKKHRYERFCLGSCVEKVDEVERIHGYIQKHLKISVDNPAFCISGIYHKKIAKFIARTVGNITRKLYKLIRLQAKKMGIYTYELRAESKASMVFQRKDLLFLSEDVLLKELLLYIMSTDYTCDRLELLRSIAPLDWDPALMPDYLQCFTSYGKRLECIDQLEDLYERIEKRGERIAMLELLDDPTVLFDSIDADCQED